MIFSRLRGIRKWVQVFFFFLIALIAVNKALTDAGEGIWFLSDASLHALCPFGGVVTLYHLAAAGTFIQKIHMSAVILMGLVFLLAVLFGPVFCGWICPLGTVQEWIGKLGRKIFGKRYNRFIPQKMDRYLRYLRYAVLIWVVFVTARSGQLLFENIDPYYALFNFWSKEVALPALMILAATLGASLVIERPWCKYLCPYGALLGIFNKVRIFKIVRNGETCISCGKCDRSCPMNIAVSNRKAVKDSQCISCLKCTSELVCPVKDTVLLQNGKKPGRAVPAAAVAGIVLLLVFGGIGFTMAADVWTTSNDRSLSGIKNDDNDGAVSLDDVRGSTTFLEAADAFGIDIEVLLEAFSVSEADGGAQMKIKDLEKQYVEAEAEIGRKSVQHFIALYKGLAFDPDEAYLPERAVEILTEAVPDLTEEQRGYLQSHKVE